MLNIKKRLYIFQKFLPESRRFLPEFTDSTARLIYLKNNYNTNTGEKVVELFESNRMYSPKEVKEKMSISKPTLQKCCKNGLQFISLPGSKDRRFYGRDLNNFFQQTNEQSKEE